MRVLRIADVADNRTGGMSRTMYGTGDALARAGVRVDYAFADALTTRWPGRLRRFGVPLSLPGLVRRRARAGQTYDIIEIHEPIAAAYCAARRRDPGLPPAVLFSYGLEERGHGAELAYRRAKGLPVSLKGRLSPYSVIAQAMYAVRHADHVICSNGDDVAYLAAKGVPRGRLTRHQSGVDEAFRAAAAAGPAIDDPTRAGRLLFVGSWIMRKGTLDLAVAVSGVLRQHPSATMTIAGCQAEQDAVRSQFDPAVRNRVEVIPRVRGDAELLDIYGRAGTLVLPSYFEGQPLVMIEAAAAGLALVMTNVCGMRDFMDDGVHGRLVAPADVGGLTAAIDEVVSDDAVRQRYGAAARCRADAYTWTAAATHILAAYRAAAGDRPPQV